MRLEEKYIFRPYNPIFPKLFIKEKQRLRKVLGNSAIIEHIGSTAVPGLGGKGVIDILIATNKNKWKDVSKKLEKLGYEYKKKDKIQEKERLFFMAYLPDKQLDTRIYHIHLTYQGSQKSKYDIGFRDYLKSHPKEREEYSQIKKRASDEAWKFKTKDEMRDTYAKIKDDFINRIMRKL